eukprot:881808-Rhodomonas_salina.4
MEAGRITMLLGVSISNHLSADAAQGLGAAIFIFLGLSDLRKACLASSLFSWPPKPITTFTLSSYLIIYVLFGARSGVDGTEDRMLLQTNADGTSSLVRIPEYSVTAATLMESIMDNVIAIEVGPNRTHMLDLLPCIAFQLTSPRAPDIGGGETRSIT